jgi:glycosyltransferase involved in cell wall biosynthesis
MGALFKADGDLLDGVIQNVRQVYPATRLVLIGNTKTSFPENQHNLKTGFVNEKQVNLYLCACDILLIPQTDTIANRGRWPSKINDYIAAGRPVAVTNVGDAANVVKKEEIGIVTAAGSIEFASGVIDLLRQPAGMEEMGKKARLLAEGKYNWDSIVQDLEAQYLRLM